MIAIADSGSTKTDWVLIENNKPIYFHTDGMNPLFTDFSVIESQLAGKSDFSDIINAVYFFGSGCGTQQAQTTVRDFLKVQFPNAEILVKTDIFGAAFSLLGSEPGVAGIMGTGVNACKWTGKGVEESAVSLGYIVGDEGSGCYLGKELLKKYFRKQLPSDLYSDMQQTYMLERTEVIENIYQKPNANRFLASFAPFWKKHENHPFVVSQLSVFFDEYFEQYVVPFLNGMNEISLIGSIAFHFQKHLKTVAKQRGLTLESVCQQPIHALADRYIIFSDSFAELFAN